MTMNTLKTKIVLTLSATVVLAACLAAYNIYENVSLKTVFASYTQNANQSNYAAALQEDLLEAHLGVMNWRVTNNDVEIKTVTDNLDQISRDALRAEALIPKPENRERIIAGVNLTAQYGNTFAKIIALQNERNQVITDIRETGRIVRETLTALSEDAFSKDDYTQAALIGRAQEKLLLSRLHIQKFIDENKQENLERAKNKLNASKTAVDRILATGDQPSLVAVSQDLTKFLTLIDRAEELINRQNQLLREGIDKIGPEINRTFEAVVESSFAEQKQLGDAAVSRLRDMMSATAVMAIVVVLLGLGVALFIWRSANVTRTHSPDTARLGRHLREALMKPDCDDIFMLLQPKIDLRTNQFVGAEALARWQSPTGMISPDIFIPIAEELNLIGLLTRKMINSAVSAQRTLKAAGYDIDIAINLSAIDIENECILSLLEDYGYQADRIILELTETAALSAPETTIPVFHRLRSSGYRIYLDDFGTGYSSLRQFVEMPIDGIKIDRSFVADMSKNRSSAVLVDLLSQAGKRLQLNTVAEGIEDEWTTRQVKSFGITHGQGYHFAKPMRVDDLVTIMHNTEDQAKTAS